MTYDFKPRSKPTKNVKPARGGRKSAPAKAALPGWLMLVALILIGSFGYGLYYLNSTRGIVTEEDSLQEVVKKATQTAPAETKPVSKDKGSTQFEFYSLLPKQAPVLSSEPQSRPASSEPAKNYHFMLQAGAFKQKADAERRRAELILSGYEAQLEPTKYNNGQTWYRLLIGPFTSQSKLAKARSELLQNNIETLVIKRNN